MTAARALGLAAALALGACRVLEAAEPPEPAVLVTPDAAVHAELVAAVSHELGRPTPVLLGDDALTRSSQLLIERVMPLGQAVEAHRLVEASPATGKIILDPTLG